MYGSGQDTASEAMPAAEPSIEGMIRADTKEQPTQLRPPTDMHHPILGMPPSGLSAAAHADSGTLRCDYHNESSSEC